MKYSRVYVVIEQLPLGLHRQFALLRELDDQAEGERLRYPAFPNSMVF